MNKLILNAGVAPRALIGSVRADANPVEILNRLNDAFDDFKDRHNARLDGVEAALDQMAVKAEGLRLNGAGGGFVAPDPNYSKVFGTYVRQGGGVEDLKQANATGYRATVHAAMSVGDPSSGGYLAPTEWDRKVQQELLPLSPMRRICNVIPTTVQAYSTLWNEGGFVSGWVGETAARPETASATLASLEFAAGEIYANPAITQRLLDDADFDVAGWIAGQVAEKFAQEEGNAFISGDGTNKPKGLLTYVTGGASDGDHPGGNLSVVNSGNASGLGADDPASADTLVNFLYGLPAPYRANATWLMNSATAAIITKLKNADKVFLWRDNFMSGQPATLLGRPVEIDEEMPDLAAGSMPIALGDFKRGYVINDRFGTRVLRDPYTNKPYVMFYTTKRVGGGVLDPKAVRLLKISV